MQATINYLTYLGEVSWVSHEAWEAKTGVECFKEEEEGVEERREFCLVEWFMEKKMLSVAGGGYLFIIYIYI